MNEPKRGRFQPGVSGNPKGRPRGSKTELTKLRAQIADAAPELVEVLMIQALNGDVSAARLLLERAIAPLRAVEQTTPMTIAGASFTDQARSILAGVESGELAPGQAAQLVDAIAGLAKIAEIDELAARVAALEGTNGES